MSSPARQFSQAVLDDGLVLLRPLHRDTVFKMDSAAAHKLIPTFLRQLKAELAFAPAPTATLLPLLVATTLGRGRTWLQPCLDSAFEDLPPSPNPVPAEPHGNPLADAQQHPRRLLVAQIKESLAKASILIGIPRAIVMLRALGHIVPEGDQSKAFVRRQLELDDRRLSDFKAASSVGLNEVYRGDLADILNGMKESGYDDAREQAHLSFPRSGGFSGDAAGLCAFRNEILIRACALQVCYPNA